MWTAVGSFSARLVTGGLGPTSYWWAYLRAGDGRPVSIGPLPHAETIELVLVLSRWTCIKEFLIDFRDALA